MKKFGEVLVWEDRSDHEVRGQGTPQKKQQFTIYNSTFQTTVHGPMVVFGLPLVVCERSWLDLSSGGMTQAEDTTQHS